ncbi:hypothetical protein H2248_010998 [Termitomyces sp. 'cryptogamus']|nr:hypothetical protein H2248_010998 [Termitomyces sp. 'cryptogamus']
MPGSFAPELEEPGDPVERVQPDLRGGDREETRTPLEYLDESDESSSDPEAALRHEKENLPRRRARVEDYLSNDERVPGLSAEQSQIVDTASKRLTKADRDRISHKYSNISVAPVGFRMAETANPEEDTSKSKGKGQQILYSYSRKAAGRAVENKDSPSVPIDEATELLEQENEGRTSPEPDTGDERRASRKERRRIKRMVNALLDASKKIEEK